MKKIYGLISIIFIFLGINLSANSLFKEHKAKIISINTNTAIVKSFPDVQIGSSGVVVHNFDKNHSSIVAKIIVINKNNTTITVKFVPFKDLEQSVLPVPKILPQVGDEVILNYLYNYALPITPNYQTYKKVINTHQDIQWLHPDLFAAKLFTENNPTPTKQDFQKMCKNYNFSLLYFAIDNTGYFVDCNSFKVIGEEAMPTKGKAMIPFFTRIKNIKTSWYSFNKSTISNYDTYYKNLIR